MTSHNNSANEAAFTSLYREHYSAVRAYASVCVPHSEIDDIVADVFVVCWRRFRDVPSDWARGWLIGVTRNVVRARNRSARRSEGFIDHLIRLRPPNWVEDNHMANEEVRQLNEAFSKLSLGDQELLLLAGPHELSVGDLAIAFGIKPGAVKVRVHRARQRLRNAVAVLDAGGEVA